MKIYDISQEILSCQVYAGDPSPVHEKLMRTDRSDLYNLSTLFMCMHNGTHADAPLHFLHGGKSIDRMELERFCGMAYVAQARGILSGEDAAHILERAQGRRHILLKGDAVVSREAAQVFAETGLLLLGNESQSVGPMDAPMAVHLTLLEKEIVLLEGIRLSHVEEGEYLLCAVPLNVAGAEGAPCRAILIDLNGEA